MLPGMRCSAPEPVPTCPGPASTPSRLHIYPSPPAPGIPCHTATCPQEVAKKPYQFLLVGVLREYLQKDLFVPTPFPFDRERVFDDFGEGALRGGGRVEDRRPDCLLLCIAVHGTGRLWHCQAAAAAALLCCQPTPTACAPT